MIAQIQREGAYIPLHLSRDNEHLIEKDAFHNINIKFFQIEQKVERWRMRIFLRSNGQILLLNHIRIYYISAFPVCKIFFFLFLFFI